MRGPANPSLNDMAGLLIQGFDRPPSILMPYNPPYYEDFLLRNGFDSIMAMWGYYVHKKYVKFDRLKRGARIVRSRNPGLSMRTLDMSRFNEEVASIRTIYNEAWTKNWGAVPANGCGVCQASQGSETCRLIPAWRSLLRCTVNPWGFAVALPDVTLAFQRLPRGRLLPFGILQLWAGIKYSSNRDIRLPIMGVLKAYHGRGFDVLPVLETIEKGPEYGYQGCEMSWILDNNHKLKNLLQSIGAVVDKKYAILERPL